MARRIGIKAVRIVKGDIVFHVHGEQEGAEGVYLSAKQVHGLWDAPVKTVYKTGVFQVGSSWKHTKYTHRDLELGFLIKETDSAYELNDSLFRSIFDYHPDEWEDTPTPTTIEVETELSGIRKLDVLMYEAPEFVPDLDPIMQEFGNAIFKLRAPDPMWYQDTVVSSTGSGEGEGAGYVTVENPTDQVMFQKWVLTSANWTLPDYSWTGKKGEREPGGEDAERVLDDIIVAEDNGGAVIDLDRNELMYRDFADTNIQAQLGGTKIFNHPIPPYTPPTQLAVSYTDSSGAMAQLRQPRRWSRPWGLEIDAADITMVPRLITFTADFSFQIPSVADTIDIIGIGGGRGGDGGTLVPGKCGANGSWDGVTLHRGTDIDWDITTITGTVGTGGVGANDLIGRIHGNGTNTIAYAGEDTVLNAAGGTTDGPSQISVAVSSYTFNGRKFAGTPARIVTKDGHPPGQGGAAGLPLGPGGHGARGQIWLIAYTAGS